MAGAGRCCCRRCRAEVRYDDDDEEEDNDDSRCAAAEEEGETLVADNAGRTAHVLSALCYRLWGLGFNLVYIE